MAIENLLRLTGRNGGVVRREEPVEPLARRPEIDVLVAELFLEEPLFRRANERVSDRAGIIKMQSTDRGPVG